MRAGWAPGVHLSVFAKPPRPGQVKTRLAADVGPGEAAAFARCFLEDAWALARVLVAPDSLALAASEEDPDLSRLAHPSPLWLQGDGDLGDRMARVLSRGLASHEMALVIGADSPGLPEGHLRLAIAALREADAVVGPTDDGGYYLLGVRSCSPGALAPLLAGLPWSQPHTRQATESRLRARGLRVARAPRFFDVDDAGDLQRLERALCGSRHLHAPATQAYLRRRRGAVRAP